MPGQITEPEDNNNAHNCCFPANRSLNAVVCMEAPVHPKNIKKTTQVVTNYLYLNYLLHLLHADMTTVLNINVDDIDTKF